MDVNCDGINQVTIEQLQAEVDKLQAVVDSHMVALIDADNLAKVIDGQITKRQLNARSQIADARLDYGTPFIYKYAK